MKKITLTFILFCACGVLAYAGPVSAEKNVTPMAPAPACDWTGFYIGVNAGVTEIQSWWVDTTGVWDYGASDYAQKPAFIGGGQIGYNYQWQDLVFGIEADFSGLAGADNKHTQVDCSYDCSPGEIGAEASGPEAYSWNLHSKIDFMATLRGRFGISFLDNKALIYVTGGGAYAHGKWDDYFYYPDGSGTNYYSEDFRGDDWRWGWVGGFGFEYMLNCHWSVRAEGLYTWFEKDDADINYSGSG